MSASVQQVQPIVDKLLELLGYRLSSGQLVIHFHDGVVMRAEANSIVKFRSDRPCRKFSG